MDDRKALNLDLMPFSCIHPVGVNSSDDEDSLIVGKVTIFSLDAPRSKLLGGGNGDNTGNNRSLMSTLSTPLLFLRSLLNDALLL